MFHDCHNKDEFLMGETNGQHQDGAEELSDDGRAYLWCGGRRWELAVMNPAEALVIARRWMAERPVNPLLAAERELEAAQAEARQAGEPLSAATLERMQTQLYDRAYAELKRPRHERQPTGEEVRRWLEETGRGQTCFLYLFLVGRQPDVTEQQADEIRRKVGFKRFEDHAKKVSAELLEAAQKRRQARELAQKEAAPSTV